MVLAKCYQGERRAIRLLEIPWDLWGFSCKGPMLEWPSLLFIFWRNRQPLVIFSSPIFSKSEYFIHCFILVGSQKDFQGAVWTEWFQWRANKHKVWKDLCFTGGSRTQASQILFVSCKFLKIRGSYRKCLFTGCCCCPEPVTHPPNFQTAALPAPAMRFCPLNCLWDSGITVYTLDPYFLPVL